MERILVIDDDPEVLESLKGVLSANGYEVDTAISGPDAISKAREFDYALIITDVRMPGMDGIQALGKLTTYQPHARKLIITGYAEFDAPVRAIKLSVDDYLMKPFGAELLLGSVRNALSRYRLEKQKADILRAASQTVAGVFKSILSNVEELHPGRKGHGEKLSGLCGAMAEALDLGFLQSERVRAAAAFHDLGLIGLPDRHARAAAEILRNDMEFEEIASILEFHHTAIGAENKSTPIESKILGLAEDYCALKDESNSPDQALKALKERSDDYDPELLAALSSSVLAPGTGARVRKKASDSDVTAQERLLRLAQIYALAGQAEAARDVLDQARHFEIDSRREDLRFRYLLISAQSRIRQKKFMEGYHEAEEALGIALSSNLGPRSVAGVFLELSLAKLSSSSFDQVGEMLDKSNGAFEKLQDFHGRFRALLYLALYFTLKGEKEKAKDRLEKCLKLLPPEQRQEWLQNELLALSGVPENEVLLQLRSLLPGSEESLTIHSLGPFRVYRNGHLIREEEWKSKKAKNILTFLLFNKNKPVPEDRLCEVFWGDSDSERARKSLYQCVYLLRNVLSANEGAGGEDSSYILSRRNSYQFNPSLVYWWDVEQANTHFQAASQLLAAGEKEKALDAFLKVERLYEGELLEDFPSETWCDAEREKLKKMLLTSTLQLALDDEEKQKFTEALERVSRVLEENPLDEQAATQQIRVLFKSGQRAEAVRRYHAWRELLKRELNLEPPPELLAFYLEMTTADSGPAQK